LKVKLEGYRVREDSLKRIILIMVEDFTLEVDPVGSVACAMSTPWSSSGTYEVGMRRKRNPTAATISI
jgi:hypothetical protein